jgi:hypothetical protein
MKNNFIKKLRVLRVLRGELKTEPLKQSTDYTDYHRFKNNPSGKAV